MPEKVLVVATKIEDVICRCFGAIAVYKQACADIHVVVLTSSEKRNEAARGHIKNLEISDLEEWGLPSKPFTPKREDMERLAAKIRRIRPDFIITHAKEYDTFHPDNSITCQFVVSSYAIAAAAGAYCQGLPVAARQTPMFGMEPDRPEIEWYLPDVFIDITEVYSKKESAIKSLEAGDFVPELYLEKAILRGKHVLKASRRYCKYAEAYRMFSPICVHDDFVW